MNSIKKIIDILWFSENWPQLSLAILWRIIDILWCSENWPQLSLAIYGITFIAQTFKQTVTSQVTSNVKSKW